MRNPRLSKDLEGQLKQKFKGMIAYGESRNDATEEERKTKIYSKTTYNNYIKHFRYFIDWLKKNHPEIKRLKKARKFVVEYLKYRDNNPDLSANTLYLDRAALNKFYQIEPGDKYYVELKERKRSEIKRSRGPAVRDKNFSERNNWELVCFCRGTGLRRSEIENLKGNECKSYEELIQRKKELQNKPNKTKQENKELKAIYDTLEYLPKFEYYVFVANGKGGRVRYSPIIGSNQQQIVERIKNTPENKKVWEYVSTNADIHSYRSDYATQIYKDFARNIEDIPYDKINKGTGKKYQSEVYHCRNEEKGKKLDKKAMLISSKALGHNRISIIATNYLRNL